MPTLSCAMPTETDMKTETNTTNQNPVPNSEGVGIAHKRIVSIAYCFGCSSERPCKQTGTYVYEGSEWPIFECQWCRAANTKRKKRRSIANTKLNYAEKE